MLIEWYPGMSVGIDIIDGEHRVLIGFVNKLYDAIEAGCGEGMLDDIMGELMGYTVYHFEHEEKLFSASGYPDMEFHINAHKKLIKTLSDIQSKLRHGKTEDLSIELMIFLKEWLLDHIQHVDIGYVFYVRKKAQEEAGRSKAHDPSN